MTSVTLAADGVESASVMQMGGTLEVKVTFKSVRPVLPVIGIVIKDSHGIAILGVNNKFIASNQFERTALGTISCRLSDLPLLPGNYSLDLYFGDGTHDIDVVCDAISVEVLPADVFGAGQQPPSGTGIIYWPASFALTDGSSQDRKLTDVSKRAVA